MLSLAPLPSSLLLGLAQILGVATSSPPAGQAGHLVSAAAALAGRAEILLDAAVQHRMCVLQGLLVKQYRSKSSPLVPRPFLLAPYPRPHSLPQPVNSRGAAHSASCRPRKSSWGCARGRPASPSSVSSVCCWRSSSGSWSRSRAESKGRARAARRHSGGVEVVGGKGQGGMNGEARRVKHKHLRGLILSGAWE